MKCLSCEENYIDRNAGTCRDCYEEAGDKEEELERQIDELKSKVNFLRLLYVGPNFATRTNTPCFSDVVLVASGPPGSANSQRSSARCPSRPIGLYCFRASPMLYLYFGLYIYFLASYIISGGCYSVFISNTSRSPVFKVMLENEMEESLNGTIKINDVSYDTLRTFVNYLYTAEACLDEHMARDLLVIADKYQVEHLKTYCEKYLSSILNWENSLAYYAFAHQHGAKSLLDAAMSLIMDNIDKLSKRKEYVELVEKDPHVVVEIYEAYVSKQVNIAASKDLILKA